MGSVQCWHAVGHTLCLFFIPSCTSSCPARVAADRIMLQVLVHPPLPGPWLQGWLPGGYLASSAWVTSWAKVLQRMQSGGQFQGCEPRQSTAEAGDASICAAQGHARISAVHCRRAVRKAGPSPWLTACCASPRLTVRCACGPRAPRWTRPAPHKPTHPTHRTLCVWHVSQGEMAVSSWGSRAGLQVGPACRMTCDASRM